MRSWIVLLNKLKVFTGGTQFHYPNLKGWSNKACTGIIFTQLPAETSLNTLTKDNL